MESSGKQSTVAELRKTRAPSTGRALLSLLDDSDDDNNKGILPVPATIRDSEGEQSDKEIRRLAGCGAILGCMLAGLKWIGFARYYLL
jgi:hypothetical protein